MRTYEIKYLDNRKYGRLDSVFKTTIVAADGQQALAIFHRNFKKFSPIDIQRIDVGDKEK